MGPSRRRYYLGIDIGATWVKMGIVGHRGFLRAKEEFDTREIRSPRQFLSRTQETIEGLLKASSIERAAVGGTGVGAPGWVDYSNGIVRELTNIPKWHDVPLADQLTRATGLQTFVDNDANVMAVGELIHGAGRGHVNFICLTLGTGVGGAIIINGKIYRGARGLAGEIGHMVLDHNGPRCACGANGCLERYVGNRFIVANAVRRLEEGRGARRRSTILKLANHDVNAITPKLLAEAAAQGDAIAREVWRETGQYIGTALAVLVNLLNPECFIIGGGVAKAGHVLFDPIRKTLARLAMNKLGRVTPVREAQLGEDAGIVGAATFARTCTETG
ncbi:MAG: ROK family protein [Candidatus Abyssobacteria bacterium SURF_17]|uniref:ROK family protein n=1 Tax=Candidatus Abyssobacteria bacterium SURF_17 TaxID=2093361 RepID=A0A419EZW6_9BACT|nr:MAG: ROK family protein [Candidatus Abyssubacteria bacterium SURF_17]